MAEEIPAANTTAGILGWGFYSGRTLTTLALKSGLYVLLDFFVGQNLKIIKFLSSFFRPLLTNLTNFRLRMKHNNYFIEAIVF